MIWKTFSGILTFSSSAPFSCVGTNTILSVLILKFLFHNNVQNMFISKSQHLLELCCALITSLVLSPSPKLFLCKWKTINIFLSLKLKKKTSRENFLCWSEWKLNRNILFKKKLIYHVLEMTEPIVNMKVFFLGF